MRRRFQPRSLLPDGRVAPKRLWWGHGSQPRAHAGMAHRSIGLAGSGACRRRRRARRAVAKIRLRHCRIGIFAERGLRRGHEYQGFLIPQELNFTEIALSRGLTWYRGAPHAPAMRQRTARRRPVARKPGPPSRSPINGPIGPLGRAWETRSCDDPRKIIRCCNAASRGIPNSPSGIAWQGMTSRFPAAPIPPAADEREFPLDRCRPRQRWAAERLPIGSLTLGTAPNPLPPGSTTDRNP